VPFFVCLAIASVPAVAALGAPKLGDADCPMPTPSARHTQKVAAMRDGDYDLVLVGDSITHTLQDFGGKYAPLNAVWARHFAPRRAINLGYNGYRTENILWNLQNGELEFARSPKLFMVLIVDLIRNRHPTSRVLVLRIFPRGGDSQKGVSPPEFKSSARCIETCRRAGELAAQLADGKRVFWLDINRIFLKADGTINTDLMWDLLHPSPAGAETWAQAVEPTLTRLMGDNAQKTDR
jgi:lysophospholipase L1-like esterase